MPIIETAFQPVAFQVNAFQILRTFTRPVETKSEYVGRIPAGTIRIINIKPVKNRMV